MSRGAGVLQKRITRQLGQGERSIGQLCWELADEAGAIELAGSSHAGAKHGAIRPSFYSGFHRALKGLREKREVFVSSRILTTTDVALVYPYRTRRLEVRELRKLVLPHLVRYAENRGFSRDEVELRILANLQDRELRDCRILWEKIESQLWQRGKDAEHRSVVLPLLVRGSGYFGDVSGGTRVSGSFAQHAEAAKGALPESLVDEVRTLYRLAFTKENNDRVASKGRFFAFADFGRRQGGVELNDEVLHWLVKEIPDVVKSLDGFVEATPMPEGEIDIGDWEVVRGHSFPLLLRRLVDRRIFEEHEFVTNA